MSFAALLSALLFLAAPYAQAQGLIPCTGGDACRACDLVALMNNLVSFGIYIGILLFVMALVAAGVKMIVGQGDGGLLKDVVKNGFIGLILMLCAWLVVDTGLKILAKEGELGPWNELKCVENPKPISAGKWNPTGERERRDGKPPVTGGGEQCDPRNTACSVDSLQAVGFTEKQANVMSCIAMTESSGNPNAVNQNGGACGTFQALPYHWRQSYSPCPHSQCTDASCNARMAYILSQQRLSRGQSAYADWTCPGCNNKAAGCVAKYDPGG
jgi:hypothetical protein